MSYDEPTPEERTADAMESLCHLFARAFSTEATGNVSPSAGIFEDNAVALHQKIDELVLVISDLADAVRELREAP